MDESKVRRSALPIVVPNPRSNGWALNLPKLGVSVSCSTARRLGFWKPLQSMVVLSSSPREAFCGADGGAFVVLEETRFQGPGLRVQKAETYLPSEPWAMDPRP